MTDSTDCGHLPNLTATEEQVWYYLCRASVDFESQLFTSMLLAHQLLAQSHEPVSFTITLTPRTT